MCVATMTLASIPPDAWAQTVAATEWRTGTTLSGFLGAASPSSDTNVATGLALGWEITPHFTLEGRGTWLGVRQDVDAFAATFGARFPLLPARPVVPFASVGAGVYIASFRSMSGSVPAFYRRRMIDGEGAFSDRTFDDFTVALGGGVDAFLSRHLALRPELTVLLVTSRSGTRAVPVYGVHLAYHFESHPITPEGHRVAR